MFNQCRPREAIEQYVGESYHAAQPWRRGWQGGFIEYFEQMAADYPGKRVEFKRSLARD